MRLHVEDCDDRLFRVIAGKLRPEDANEWRLASGSGPAEWCAQGRSLPSGQGTRNRIAFLGDDPLCVLGVNPTHRKSVGWAWLVATPKAVPLAVSVHRAMLPEWAAIKAMYPKIVTASLKDNAVHHQWLEWLGFRPTGRNAVSEFGGVFRWYHFER